MNLDNLKFYFLSQGGFRSINYVCHWGSSQCATPRSLSGGVSHITESVSVSEPHYVVCVSEWATLWSLRQWSEPHYEVCVSGVSHITKSASVEWATFQGLRQWVSHITKSASVEWATLQGLRQWSEQHYGAVSVSEPHYGVWVSEWATFWSLCQVEWATLRSLRQWSEQHYGAVPVSEPHYRVCVSEWATLRSLHQWSEPHYGVCVSGVSHITELCQLVSHITESASVQWATLQSLRLWSEPHYVAVSVEWAT
jgi:hypothetical protein